MIYLLAASLLWAFSFGLIKGQLVGLDPSLVALVRLLLAALAFTPLLLRARPRRDAMAPALALGALQFGVMYVLYIASFGYLPAWLVALFTVTTPLYVVLLAGLRDGRLPRRFLFAVVLAVSGAAVVAAPGLPAGSAWAGVALLQGANLCFAAGQVFYPGLARRSGLGDAPLLGLMYWGALGPPAVLLALSGDTMSLPRGGQVWALVYLGVAPTAAGFYLWNKGAARVQSGVLAGANNLKVPLAVLVSWTVFGEEAPYLRALLGLALVTGALFIAGRPGRKRGEAGSGCADHDSVKAH